MKYLSLLGNMVAVAAIAAFLFMAFRTPGVASGVSLDAETVAKLGAGVLIYVAAVSLGGVVWQVLLRSAGVAVSLRTAASIVFVSQAAKYVPGNVAHHVGRVVLARRRGMGTAPVLFTMFLEFAWLIGTAALMTLIYMLAVGAPGDARSLIEGRMWALGLLIALPLIALFAGHRVVGAMASWWARRRNIEIAAVGKPTPVAMVLVSLLHVLGFIMLGALLLFIARAVFAADAEGVLVYAGIFAMAWVLGFLAPGAPAGLGIREVVLVAAVTPLLGKEVGIGIAAVLRLVSLSGDGVLFLLGLLLSRGLAKPG